MIVDHRAAEGRRSGRSARSRGSGNPPAATVAARTPPAATVAAPRSPTGGTAAADSVARQSARGRRHKRRPAARRPPRGQSLARSCLFPQALPAGGRPVNGEGG